MLIARKSRVQLRSFKCRQFTEKKEKERLVILGSGWGSANVLRRINTNKYNVFVVSPRNHFLFTPLLASTTVGTLDFRSIIEPIRPSRPNPNIHYYQSKCTGIDLDNKTITCAEPGPVDTNKASFTLKYDKLVIGVGASANTFNIPGVKQHAYFLKELRDARRIRGRLIELFEKASLPTRSIEEIRELLHIVIVGGGPTGVEFAGELSDFFWRDVTRYFPDLPVNEMKITLLEASHRILSAFDASLVNRAVKAITRSGVYVRTGTLVKEVLPNAVVLGDGSVIKCGMVVWVTGVGPRALVQNLNVPHNHGRLQVDNHLRVAGTENVYALGDCAEIEDMPLAPTAQVAQQQGKYLAKILNSSDPANAQPFKFLFRGIMLYAGNQKSVLDSKYFKGFGFVSWILWRSVYPTRLGSLKNKFQVPGEWLRTIIWGRDVTSFGDSPKDLED